MISRVLIVLLSLHAVLSQNCRNIENTVTKQYTYHICKDTAHREFSEARLFCEQLETETGNPAHLIVFPNEVEFSFIISELNKTEDENFRFYPGIYQKSDETRKYNPETGEFYWITDEENNITPESETYWQPFSSRIENFNGLGLKEQQKGNFLMDKQGLASPAVKLRGTLPSDISDPTIICMSSGILEPELLATKPPGESRDRRKVIDTWVIIVIAAGAIFTLILAGVSIGCCISKQRNKKFQKVPTEEKKPPQNLPPSEYQA